MIEQAVQQKKHVDHNIYYFKDYHCHKPFFKKNVKITVGITAADTYYLIQNIVYQQKQILALSREEDAHTVYLVEARIQNGQLTHILQLSEEYQSEIVQFLGVI